MSEPVLERIQKRIAASGLLSRRAAEQYILEGKVKVNGVVVRDLARKISPDDQISVQNKPLVQPKRVSYLFYKPKGVVCSKVKQDQTPIVTDYFPKVPSVYPAGRLDKESEGLLIMTNDGALTNQVTHPSFQHSKTYRVLVHFKPHEKHLTIVQASHKLLTGVKLGDGRAKADQLQHRNLSPDHYSLVMVVHEGRTHLVRRMCASVGLEVTQLKRVAIGPIGLGNLKPGDYRPLSAEELSALQ